LFPKKLGRAVICNHDEPIVRTKAGKLRGLIVDGTYIFRGIKYADAKRFRMPEPVRPWDGVKEAIIFGPVCTEIQTGIAHDAYYVPHFYYPQDEHCQYLNIWTQSPDSKAKKPVMVWLHGGGFSTGSSVELFAYDGENLSRHGDVVVVSLNHRLNVLGFLDLSPYSEKFRYSANIGMADIVAALRWIRDNIEAFGGDPDNVTIMGQSGGGGKVAALLQIPSADGLYKQAVIQSGMTPGGRNTLPSDAQKLSALILENLGISPENVDEIQRVPIYKLNRAAFKAQERLAAEGIRIGWGPVYDNDFYKGNALSEAGFREETKHIPIIIGSNMGEFAGNATRSPYEAAVRDWTPEQREKLYDETFGPDKEKARAAFRKAYPDKDEAYAPLVDTMFREGVIAYSKARAKAGCAPCYTYMFSLEMPYLGGTLAWHNAEEAYMFHNAECLEASYIPGVSERLQDVMTGAWVAFARTGDPNHAEMPAWYPVTSERDATMIFDTKCEMRYDFDHELIKLLSASGRPGFAGLFSGMRSLGGGPRQAI
jgi:para-nitrobenzyl esterase